MSLHTARRESGAATRAQRGSCHRKILAPGLRIGIGIGASSVREREPLRGVRLLPRIARPGQVTLVPPGAPQAATRQASRLRVKGRAVPP